MVRRASHERYARDGGAGDARRGGGCVRGAHGDCAPGYQEFIGVLCFVAEIAHRGEWVDLACLSPEPLVLTPPNLVRDYRLFLLRPPQTNP